ncbi:hypothetical protein SAMN05444362_11765 [Dysgonomonas macrotermitis]|uniref:Uncharacterized protein n=1 Tax=Dysgonomonas macrotermitis TaxID=1346286 RepID=A0A1M5HWI6_9BACT|nr:hypothetical protein SAMN05444362_11765 [Dysgonomonas macrotermitis]
MSPVSPSMVNPNDDSKELQKLKDEFDINPDSLSDAILLTLKDKVTERQEQYPSTTEKNAVEYGPTWDNRNKNVAYMEAFGRTSNIVFSYHLKQVTFSRLPI